MKDLKSISLKSKNIIDFSRKYFERLQDIFKSVDKKKIEELEKNFIKLGLEVEIFLFLEMVDQPQMLLQWQMI